jgi:UDP-N-acetyl-D-glucosamine dehydrogenase
MEKLEEAGAIVDYNDPYIPVIHKTREHAKYAGRRSVPITGDYDLLLIATAHDAYRSRDLLSYGIPVVDTRNVVRGNGRIIYRA